MGRFILRRLLLMVAVLLGMGIITFCLTHLVPGDPARLLAGQHATAEEVQAVARLYGLDQPLPMQCWVYMRDLAQGDLGLSLTNRRPVLDDLRQFLPASMELTFAAVLIVVVIGLPVGLAAGVRRGKPSDHLLR